MRTIIVNTLGTDFLPSDLFYRSLRKQDLFWITSKFSEIAECAEKIENLRSRLNTSRGYHLVVLADITYYEQSENQNVRERLKKLMTAYLLKQLMPKLEQTHNIPCSLSLILVCRETWQKTIGLEGYRPLLGLQNLKAETGLVLRDKDRRGNDLVFTEIFGTQLKKYWEHLERNEQKEESKQIRHDGDLMRIEKKTPELEEQEHRAVVLEAVKQLDAEIEVEVKQLQRYLIKERGEEEFIPQTCVFCPEPGMSTKLVYADIQINLARLMKQLQVSPEKPDLSKFLAHSPEELSHMIFSAKRKVEALLKDNNGPKYLPLEAQIGTMETAQLRTHIMTRLEKEASGIFGVKEYLENEKNGGNVVQRIKKAPARAWLRYNRERKLFREQYDALQDQYDAGKVDAEERQITALCAEEFSKWRRDVRDTVAQKQSAQLELRPKLEDVPAGDAGTQVQEALFSGVLERLENYEDVRDEAEKVRREFERVSRLWEPEPATGAVPPFRKLTLIMAILSVITMMIPYAVMTWAVDTMVFPKMIVLAVSAGIFALLYLGAVLLCLWKMCKDMSECRDLLQELLEQSRACREASIMAMVELYCKKMPTCMEEGLIYECLRRIDQLNEERENCWTLHKCYLTEDNAELEDLRTACRISELQELTEEVSVPKIDYTLPPYAKANQDCYEWFERKEKRR